MQTETEQKKNKALMSGTLIYAIGSFGSKIVSFFLVPVYTYFIATADYGDYDLLASTIGLLVPIISLQIADAGYRWMIRHPEDSPRYLQAVYKVLFGNCLITFPIVALVCYFAHVMYAPYFIALLYGNTIFATLQKLLRGVMNQKLFAASGIFYTVVLMLGNIWQICYLKRGAAGLFTSAIMAYALGIVFILVLEKRIRIELKWEKTRQLQKEMIAFAAPLVPNYLNWWVMNASDRYVIRFFLGAQYNGIYSIACKFPSLLQTITTLFNNSWTDMNLAEREAHQGEYHTKVFRSMYRFSFSVVWVIAPLSKLYIRYTMSGDYKQAVSFVSFLYLGAIFQTFSSFYGVGYLKNKNTKDASLTSIYGAVINLAVNLILIPFIGLQAASISTFLGYFVMWLMRVRQTRDTLEIELKTVEFSMLLFVTLIWCGITVYTNAMVDGVLCLVGGILFVIVNHHLLMQVLKKCVTILNHRYNK